MTKRIEFGVHQVWPHAGYSILSGRVHEADILVGDVFTELAWSPLLPQRVNGSYVGQSTVTYAIALRVEEIQTYGQSLSFLSSGMTGALKLTGQGREVLLSVDPAARDGVWLLRGESIEEENERLELEAELDRCDRCREPKREFDHRSELANGIHLLTFATHCGQNNPACTALVAAYLLNQPATVTDRIVQWLAEQPDMKAAGVRWMGCLAVEADRLLLTYPVPVSERVATTVAAIRVEVFTQEPVGPPCQRCGQPISLQRLQSIPHAKRCWECQTEVERLSGGQTAPGTPL